MSVLGGPDAVTVVTGFLLPLAVIAVFSGIFVRLNRDIWVEALAASVAWMMAAYIFLGVFAGGWYWPIYWVFPVVAVGYIVGLGSLITLVRRRRPTGEEEDAIVPPQTGPHRLPSSADVPLHRIRPVVNRLR